MNNMKIIKEYVLEQKNLIKKTVEKYQINKKLVIIQSVSDGATNAYVKGKCKDCDEVGIAHEVIRLDESAHDIDYLVNLIKKLNIDETVGGIIVQLPLFDGWDVERVQNAIDPRLDIDGFHKLTKFLPATPRGMIDYLKDNDFSFTGKNAVVIGRSEIVGRPMAKILLDLNMNVTITHSKTTNSDLRHYLENADLVVIAIGKANFLDKTYKFKENAVILDVGISRTDGHLVGDCENDVQCYFKSPVPGGVGLLTRLGLLKNFIDAQME